MPSGACLFLSTNFVTLDFASQQVPEADLASFNTFLMELQYPHFHECDNLAYKRFLAGQ